jgi:hydrogenase maturation protein HypF
MVDARNADAVRTLRQRKVRRERPLAVMVAGIEDARRCCEADADACALLASPAAPIVLLRRLESAPIDPGVAAGTPYLGIFLAYTPLHLLLLQATGFAVVATSGNLSDEPICIDEGEALQRLHGVADLFLVHDRPIARHVDDGLVWRVEAENRVLRRARGDAPRPLHLDRGMPPLLAVGAHLKNCVAVSVGKQAVLSQHIGDMGSPEAFAAFERVVADLLDLFRVRPLAVAHDRHPDYATTRWAAASGLPCVAVQHHHAHLAACLADDGWDGEALGVTWDGTGYGDDGSVWGGEFLLGSAAGFRRVAHLRPFRLPGGDVAAREPRRPALAVLVEALGPGAFERDDLAPVRAFAAAERAVLATMIERGVGSPWTSSAGRLFDALASLVGIRQATTFEGQAAMAVEFAAADARAGAYPLDLVAGDAGVLVLDWRPLVRAVVDDLAAGTGSGVIAARFHDGLAAGIVRVAREVGCVRVALSGGCFQNRRLLEASTTALRAAGFQVLLHRRVPPGDGGIALGQLAVAASRLG